MIFVPLPFVVALLLVILLVAMLRNVGDGRENWPFIALLALSALQSVLVGLRWGYGVPVLQLLMPVAASCLPALAYASLRSLTGGEASSKLEWRPAAFWPVVTALALILSRDLVDALLICLFVGYAIAILLLGRQGEDAFDRARLSEAIWANRARYIAAAGLLISAFLDIAVWLDIVWRHGESAAMIAFNGNIVGLFMLGLTAAMLAKAQAHVPGELETETAAIKPSSAEDREIVARIETALAERKLYLDDNLTLSRLARRVGIPARQISTAVNRSTGSNMSQFINAFRVREACELLRDDQRTVTTAMLESGFLTKSNFNREFRRVTGMSPAAWRMALSRE